MNIRTIMLVGLTPLLFFTQTLVAGEQSRDDYLQSMRTDLLKPCSENRFIQCVDSNEAECLVRINNLIQDCKVNLPVIMTDLNRDESADKFSVCFDQGLVKKFSISEEKYNSCLKKISK